MSKPNIVKQLRAVDSPDIKGSDLMLYSEAADEIERLRELLRAAVPYVVRPYPSNLRTQLIDRIIKEVNDE